MDKQGDGMANLVGRRVSKHFAGHDAPCEGEVVHYNSSTKYFTIRYDDDGDEEELSLRMLQGCLTVPIQRGADDGDGNEKALAFSPTDVTSGSESAKANKPPGFSFRHLGKASASASARPPQPPPPPLEPPSPLLPPSSQASGSASAAATAGGLDRSRGASPSNNLAAEHLSRFAQRFFQPRQVPPLEALVPAFAPMNDDILVGFRNACRSVTGEESASTEATTAVSPADAAEDGSFSDREGAAKVPGRADRDGAADVPARKRKRTVSLSDSDRESSSEGEDSDGEGTRRSNCSSSSGNGGGGSGIAKHCGDAGHMSVAAAAAAERKKTDTIVVSNLREHEEVVKSFFGRCGKVVFYRSQVGSGIAHITFKTPTGAQKALAAVETEKRPVYLEGVVVRSWSDEDAAAAAAAMAALQAYRGGSAGGRSNGRNDARGDGDGGNSAAARPVHIHFGARLFDSSRGRYFFVAPDGRGGVAAAAAIANGDRPGGGFGGGGFGGGGGGNERKEPPLVRCEECAMPGHDLLRCGNRSCARCLRRGHVAGNC
ncbi:unnamed protein product, partial [Phaeothamnion confervicola]